MLSQHEEYMQRCIQLAKLGAGKVAPNPMVGAVLVYKNRIIGEGYHQQYGQAHAEVICINSVSDADKNFINQSVLYVSLEPCAHFGKTPPCSDLIIRNKIPKVMIGSVDAFEQVNRKGIEKLKAAGVSVEVGILEKECMDLNKRFFIFHAERRPYIILKWAQTADNKIASMSHERLIISNELSKRLVHKWRTQEAAILVGTTTITVDDPLLTNRLWTGKNPVRLVIDKNLKIPITSKIFNNDAPTIVFNYFKDDIDFENDLSKRNYFYPLNQGENIIDQILTACYKLNIQSVFVEGGAKLLQEFINAGLCDEIRTITNENLFVGNGLEAPTFPNRRLFRQFALNDDVIRILT